MTDPYSEPGKFCKHASFNIRCGCSKRVSVRHDLNFLSMMHGKSRTSKMKWNCWYRRSRCYESLRWRKTITNQARRSAIVRNKGDLWLIIRAVLHASVMTLRGMTRTSAMRIDWNASATKRSLLLGVLYTQYRWRNVDFRKPRLRCKVRFRSRSPQATVLWLAKIPLVLWRWTQLVGFKPTWCKCLVYSATRLLPRRHPGVSLSKLTYWAFKSLLRSRAGVSPSSMNYSLYPFMQTHQDGVYRTLLDEDSRVLYAL